LPDMSAGATLQSVLQEIMDRQIRPYIQAHGGDVEVAGIDRGHVSVTFCAACNACELRMVTFAATVRPKLLAVPGVDSVTCASVPLSPERLDAISRFFR
jgi:Fe-S cluster biogenesis protein NfuA